MKHVVILISGKQGSGKSSLADNLSKTLEQKGISSYRTRFAKVLYLMHDAVRDIGKKYGINFPDKMGPLLQYMGTELVRNNYGEDAWVNCLKQEVSLLKERKFIIIDDARFLNEINAFDNNPIADAFKIRLNAPKEVRKNRTHAWRDNDTHLSETELDNYHKFNLNIDTSEINSIDTVDLVIKALTEWKN